MPELHVSKKNISKLLSDMQGRKFIIPDYQRPYSWQVEKCETLWNDINDFRTSNPGPDSDYFLGTVVSYVNGKNQEIIDGQQRITSFFLLLRAFYRKLEDMDEDQNVRGLKNQLAPCLWDINRISQEVDDKSKIHIVSQVATVEDNDIFHDILKTGTCDESATDRYSENYRFFKKCCDQFAEQHPMQWKELCVTILQQCIVLPIECDTPETALTIFSTLNDRGMPLADSDIFKAQIYKNLSSDEDRKEFTDTWKELTRLCKQAYMSIDDVFRYYSHVLRGRAHDKSKEVGLRKFYAENKYARLKVPELLEDIMFLARFWHQVNTGDVPTGDVGYEISPEAWKYLHCLDNYPNEYWKYATSVYFLKTKGGAFTEGFAPFLKKLAAFLFAKFIDRPTVNAIKDDIYSACISINNDGTLGVSFSVQDDFLQSLEVQKNGKLQRGLLLLHAYLNPKQHRDIPWYFDIEHIFPKKWQTANYNGWSEEEAQTYLDKLGNKVVIETKLNIQAGNGYFGRKKDKYSKSEIADVLALVDHPTNDWLKQDIENREQNFKDRIINFFATELME